MNTVTVNNHDSTFKINDITLTVPPTAIKITKDSFNNQWQTLRTNTSQKTKSGYSTVTIEFQVPFIGYDEVHTKLKPLVAQLRYMPFCFVENQFIRENLFPQEKQDISGNTTIDFTTIVLAMRAISISARNDMPGTLWATFQFAYFNYLPYTPYWQYKADLFGPDADKTVSFPEDSNAWKQFIAPAVNKSTVAKAPTGEAVLSFLELRTAPVDTIENLAKTKEILSSISNDQKSFFDNFRKTTAPTPDQAIVSAIRDTFPRYKDINQIAAVDALGPLLINAGPSSNPLSKRYRSDGQYIDQSELKKVYTTLNQRFEAREQLDANLSATDDAFELIKNWTFQDNRGEGFGVYKRVKNLGFNKDNGIIIEGITIAVQNILATIPIAGHRYATFQHIGSIDATVYLDMKVTNDDAMTQLSFAYDAINDNSINNRHVPQGLQTVRIDNDVLAVFNLDEFITQDMETSTIEGSPGTYQVKMSFIESGLKQNDVLDVPENDKFHLEFASNDERVAQEIAKILGNNIKIVNTPQIFSNDKKYFSSTVNNQRNSRFAAIVKKYIGDQGPSQQNATNAINNLPGANLNGGPSADILSVLFGDKTPEQKTATTINSRSALNLFADQISELVFKTFVTGNANMNPQFMGDFAPAGTSVIRKSLDYTVGDTDLFNALMGMTESDCPGISKVQELIFIRAKQENTLDKNITSQTAKPLSDVLAQNRALVTKGAQVDQIRRAQALNQKINFDTITDIPLINQITGFSDAAPGTAQSGIFDSQLAISTDKLLQTKPFINWFEFLNSFTTAIMESDDINLPEFVSAKKLINDLNLNRGLPAYQDFDLINILPEEQKNNPDAIMSLDPDCFLSTPSSSSADKFIDPALITTAKQMAQTSVNTALTQVEKYYQDSWFPSAISDSIKKKITANISSTVNQQGAPDKSASPPGSIDMYYSKSTAGGKFQNAGFVNTVQLGALNLDNDQTRSSESNPVTMQIQRCLNHSLDPADLFQFTNTDKQLINANLDTKASKKSIPSQRGRKLTSSTLAPDGTINESPSVLASQCGQDPECYALARMIASEDGNADETTKTAIALAALNYKQQHGNLSLATILTNSTYKNAKGKFGSQVGRYAATAIDPHEDDLRIAKNVLNGNVADFTGGASKWSHPAAQNSQKYRDSINKIGAQRGGNIRVLSFNDLVAKRAADGDLRIEVPGTDPNHIVFFKNSKVKNKYAYTPPTPSTPNPDTGIAAGGNVADLSIQAFETSLRNGQGLRLVRAFPAFKLYFIQDNSANRRRYGLDDFFSYNSVAEIECIRSRKIPADLLRITLTNVSGVLSNRKFQGPRLTDNDTGLDESVEAHGVDGAPLEADPNGFLQMNSNSKKKQLASMMLQSGNDVELRLGYANDPNKLTTVFVGKIMEIEFSDSDDLVQIICQSHAIELVQDLKGLAEPKIADGYFINDARTDLLLEQLMASPELIHFGRWIRSKSFNSDTNTNRSLLTNKFSLTPTPQDDNIFVPPIEKLKEMDPGFVFNKLKYAMYQTTIWDVFDEMTLRHPGWVKSPVPYKDKVGPRMTMFFGLPSQLYFAADPTSDQKNETFKKQAEVTAYNDNIDQLKKSVGILNPDLLAQDPRLQKRDFAAEALQLAKDYQTIRPFRSYHLVTSKQHIVSNNIRASAKGTHNTVSVQYGDSEFNKDVQQLVQTGTDVLTLPIDAALPDEEIRELFVQYPNCQSKQLARNYATGLLMREMKDVYRGELTVIGNPEIKPYDIVNIFDDYNDIMGPVEVEQVIHRFSQDTGFITEITPDLYVTANEWVNMTVTDMMSIIIEGTCSKLTHGQPTTTEKELSSTATRTDSLILLGAGLALSPIAAVVGAGLAVGGYFMMQKMVDFTSHGQPIVIHPLIHRGKPWVAGLPMDKLNNLWSTNKGQWFKEAFEGLDLGLSDFDDKLTLAVSQGKITNLFSGSDIGPKF
jgi:hypothetical protein